MNKLITNLAFITPAAEYFDKQTSAAWRLRASLTNMVVWAANSVLYAQKADNAQQLANAQIKLATLREWVRDVNSTGFTLDLTNSAVSKTLGIDREVDVHVEAKRIARMKCSQQRSAAKFEDHYKTALAAFEERKREREASVSQIAELVSDRQTFISMAVADVMEYRDIASLDANSFVDDSVLYDDASVEREIDTLSDTVANLVVLLDEVNQSALASTIVDSKIKRCMAFDVGIKAMMQIVGIDTGKLKERCEKLNASIKAAEDKVEQTQKAMDAEIEAKLTELAAAPVVTSVKPNVHTVKSDARVAREKAEALDAESKAEYKKAQAKAKRAATKKVKSLAQIGELCMEPGSGRGAKENYIAAQAV